MLLSPAERSACLAAAGAIAGNILDRAKVQGSGLSWDSGYSARSPKDRRALERSLGFGTPGILLFLAEYLRHANDTMVRDYVGAAFERMHALYLRHDELQPGFFVGYWGGAYALHTVEQLTGFSCGPQGVLGWLPDAVHERREENPDTGSGIANGVAGSLLGLDLLAAGLDAELVRRHRELYLQGLLRRLHLATAGLACGWHFDAIQPPLGFFSGSAGVRYVLGRYARAQDGWAWLGAGMELYEDAAFSDVTGNWRDFLNEAYFNGEENARTLNRAAMRADPSLFQHTGDAIGWGPGTAGIMLAHAAATAREPAAVAARQRALERGWARLRSALAHVDPADDRFTLYDGWGGVALSLMHCCDRGVELGLEDGVRRVVAGALEQEQQFGRFRTRAWNEAGFLSLLEGEAGIGYFLLKAVSGVTDGSILAPAPAPAESPAFPPAEAQRTILRNALPLTVRLLEDARKEVVLPASASIAGFVGATQEAVASLHSELADDVLAFETTRLKLRQATRSNLYLASREAFREQVYSTLFAQASDAVLLRGRFRLIAEARLGVLPFLLPAGAEELPRAGQSTAILMYVCSDGMRETVLTPTAYGVLFRLSRVKSVRALLRRARREWPLVEYEEAEARRLVAEILRAGLAAGYLESLRR